MTRAYLTLELTLEFLNMGKGKTGLINYRPVREIYVLHLLMQLSQNPRKLG